MSGSGTEVDSDNKGDTIQVIIGLKCKNSSVTACAKTKICQKRVNRKQSFRHKLGALHSMTAVRRIVVKSKTGQLQALSWQLGISLGHNIV